MVLSKVGVLIHHELSGNTNNTAPSSEKDLWKSSALIPLMLLLSTESQGISSSLYLQPTGIVPHLTDQNMASRSKLYEQQRFMSDFNLFLNVGRNSCLDLLNSNKLDHFISSSYLSP